MVLLLLMYSDSPYAGDNVGLTDTTEGAGVGAPIVYVGTNVGEAVGSSGGCSVGEGVGADEITVKVRIAVVEVTVYMTDSVVVPETGDDTAELIVTVVPETAVTVVPEVIPVPDTVEPTVIVEATSEEDAVMLVEPLTTEAEESVTVKEAAELIVTVVPEIDVTVVPVVIPVPETTAPTSIVEATVVEDTVTSDDPDVTTELVAVIDSA